MKRLRHVRATHYALSTWVRELDPGERAALGPSGASALELYLGWAQMRGWSLKALSWASGAASTGGYEVILQGEDVRGTAYPSDAFRPYPADA